MLALAALLCHISNIPQTNQREREFLLRRCTTGICKPIISAEKGKEMLHQRESPSPPFWSRERTPFPLPAPLLSRMQDQPRDQLTHKMDSPHDGGGQRRRSGLNNEKGLSKIYETEVRACVRARVFIFTLLILHLSLSLPLLLCMANKVAFSVNGRELRRAFVSVQFATFGRTEVSLSFL